VQIALALVLTIVSACALDLGYLLQRDVAARLPPLSLRRPLASVRSLLREPRWLIGSGIQVGGFVLYVVALALAPLALVQAAAAGGIGILAIMVSRITHAALTRRERVGAAVSVLGLVLLGVSLLSSHGEGQGRPTSGSRSGSERRPPPTGDNSGVIPEHWPNRASWHLCSAK
jgi:hypothetical protein